MEGKFPKTGRETPEDHGSLKGRSTLRLQKASTAFGLVLGGDALDSQLLQVIAEAGDFPIVVAGGPLLLCCNVNNTNSVGPLTLVRVL